MKKRSIVAMIILNLVTLGIYSIYWNCSFQNQLKKTTGKGFGGFGHLMMMIFTFGIYSLYWQFAAGKRLVALNVKNDYAIIYLIMGLIGLSLISMFIMQAQANEVAQG